MPRLPRDALTVARIVRVNHAGEHGAIRIYSAQIAVASRLYPDVVPALAEMPARRSAPPCPPGSRGHAGIMSLWSLGGSLLGFLTALLGRQSIWVCTAAVEAAVHRHLDDQLYFLKGRDSELHAIILSIREEELAHLHHAEAQLHEPTAPRRLLRRAISMITDALIWLSTWGDSSRMARDLCQAR